MLKNKKGFTLIELIIVMAIIGILAVVAIVAISGKTVDARNARRMSDISAVRTALAISCAENTDAMTADETADLPQVCLVGNIESLVFTNVVDPRVACAAAGTDGCTVTAGATTDTCQYAFGKPANGAVFASDGDGTDDVEDWVDGTDDFAGSKPYCNYWINFKLEGQAAKSSATESGLLTNS